MASSPSIQLDADEAAWIAPELLPLMQAELDKLSPGAAEKVDTQTLKRFSIARKGNPAEAAKMLARHLQWKQEFRTWKHTPSLTDIKPMLDTGVAYVRHSDAGGRPFIFVDISKHDGYVSREPLRQFVVFIIEEAVARSLQGSGAGSFNVVIEAGSMGYKNLDLDAAKYVLLMLSANYPERLHSLYICNSGMIFSLLWKAIQSLLDARTSKKIHFVSSKELVERLGSDIVPTWAGGKDSWEYKPEKVTEASSPDCCITVRASLEGEEKGLATPAPEAATGASTAAAAGGAGQG